MSEKKYFRIKKRIDQIEKDKFWSLGEKAIKFEPFQARMYTHGNLFSHIVGQVDYDNYGISGIEKYFDKEIITPGIRFNSKKDDQKRTRTPKQAFKNGSDWLVIGRPITKGNIKNNLKNLTAHLI